MKQSKAKIAKINVIVSLLTQILTLALGFVIPRLLLTSYGSEVNGLTTTVTQIFVYVGLLEAGISSASLFALYKPFANDDQYEISDIFSATKLYFRKVTVIYALCVIGISLVYPVCVKSSLDYITIMLVILLQGLANVITFALSNAHKTLLLADGKNYIVSAFGLVIYIISSVAKIVLMNLGFSIVALQVSHVVINGISAGFYIYITRKKYPWLKTHKKPKMEALSQRSAFVVHETAGVIFSSTDAFMISTFCSLAMTSVYTIYNLVIHSIYIMINSVFSGLYYLLGQSYGKGNKEEYVSLYDAFESAYMFLSFAAFSVAYVLLVPFVRLYTTGISDIQYVDYLLPILFVVTQLMSSSRMVAAKMVSIAGHAQKTQNRAIFESVIKIIASVVLVQFLGIYGVLLSTVVSLSYRMNDLILYVNKRIIMRSVWHTYKKVFVNFLFFAVIVALEYIFRTQLSSTCSNYFMFVVYGLLFTVVLGIAYFIAIVLTNRKIITMLKIFIPGFRKKAVK